METEFKFIKKPQNVTGDNNKLLLEIAYQLKRIADKK